MRCKKNILILVLLIALVLNSFGQNKGNTVALKSVLDAISQQHSVTFNYLENDLVPFKIIPPEKKLTLTEKLAYITENTQLQFLFVTKDYISVVKNKVEEKIICGYLKDFDTKEKLNNASIHYIGTTIYTISDENGYFELPLNTETSLEIDYLGYEKTILEASSLSNTKNCATLFLKVKSSQLNEIIATYFYLTKGIAQKSNGTFEIQPKKFGILPGLTEPDVLQTIQQLPGITSVDETITNINVRGGSHDQNLVLWNNIRLFQTGHFFGLISVFNPNLPSKVTITKNGSSAFYSESTSSVIDISTESNESNNSVGINMINVDFNTTLVKSNSTSLTVSGRRSFTDAIASPTYTNYYNRIFQNTVVTNLNNNENITYNSNENFYFYDFSAQWSQKITEKLNVVVNLISIYNQFDVFQSKEEKNILLDRSSYINQKTYGGTIFSTYNWNEKTKSELNVYGSYYKIDSKNEALEGNQIFKQENDILDTAIQLKNTHSITPNLTFTNGYQFNEIGVRNTDEINTPQFARKIKDVLQTHAVIVEAHHFTANQKLETTFGMRHNYITKFKKNLFEPRLQMNYSLSNSLNLLLLGEIKHQTSSQVIDLQQDFLGVEKRRWVLADNETIPIQISNQISLSATYKKNNWLLSLENFYKKVEGINSRSQGFQNQLEFEIIKGKYKSFGSELIVQKQIDNFTSWLTYTYTKNDYTFEEYVPPSFSNNFEILHNFNFGIMYDYKNLKTTIGGRWHTGQPTTNPVDNTIVNNTINYELPNSSRISSYVQLNLSSGYDFKFSNENRIQVGLSIQNVLNRKNIINQYYRINQNTNTIEKVNTYSLELTPNAFVRYHFK